MVAFRLAIESALDPRRWRGLGASLFGMASSVGVGRFEVCQRGARLVKSAQVCDLHLRGLSFARKSGRNLQGFDVLRVRWLVFAKVRVSRAQVAIASCICKDSRGRLRGAGARLRSRLL